MSKWRRDIMLNMPVRVQQPNEIWYTTTDGSRITTPRSGYTFAQSGNEPLYSIYTVVNGSPMGIMKFPNNVTEICGGFGRKTNLQSIYLPSTTRSIRSQAFSGCTKLASISLNDGLQSIESWAFYNTKLSSITFPNSVVLNSANALFYECKSLEYVYNFPQATTVIPAEMFYTCTKLKTFTIPDNITSIGRMAFHRCSNFRITGLPVSLVSIENSAMGDCSVATGMTELELPANLSSIGQYGLRTVKVLRVLNSTRMITGSADMFYYTDASDRATIYVPSELVSAYANDQYWRIYEIIPYT